mmetsp:Transcript_20142/g.36461  ORF Transcript_20142/g.36461 Transcript_20142/m.36461 type:complete len:208 (-) Transcript_20142:22-645(-)
MHLGTIVPRGRGNAIADGIHGPTKASIMPIRIASERVLCAGIPAEVGTPPSLWSNEIQPDICFLGRLGSARSHGALMATMVMLQSLHALQHRSHLGHTLDDWQDVRQSSLDLLLAPSILVSRPNVHLVIHHARVQRIGNGKCEARLQHPSSYRRSGKEGAQGLKILLWGSSARCRSGTPSASCYPSSCSIRCCSSCRHRGDKMLLSC